jgi:hypothetical protein
MDLIPDCADAEDYDKWYERAQHDDRVTFPLESLPLEIKALFKRGKDGKQWAAAQVFYICNCLVWVPDPNYSKSNNLWRQMECGLVHAAVTGYDYSHHPGTRQSHRYKCKCCVRMPS